MADISVTLGLDDSKYTSGINKAANAAKAFGTTATNGMKSAEDGMGRLGNAANTLKDKFGGIGTAIAGAGIVAFAHSLLQGANDLNDMAEAAGVSVQAMMELGASAAGAGSSMESAANMMEKMTINVEAAANGSQKMQDALDQLGLKTNAFLQLNTEDRMKAIVTQLASMTDHNKRLALATEIFGKKAMAVGWESFAANITKTSGSMGKFAEANKNASAISEKLKLNMMLFRNSVLELLNPLLSAGGSTDDMASAMNRAKIAAELLLGIFAAYAASSIISMFSKLGGIVMDVAKWLGLVAPVAAEAAAGIALFGAASGGAAASATILAGANARLMNATTGVALAEIKLAAAQAENGTSAAVLAKLEDNLAAASLRLAQMQNAVAVSTQRVALVQGEALAVMGATGVATATAATGAMGFAAIWARLGAVMAGVGASIMGVVGLFTAPVWATIAAVVAAIAVAFKVFGPELRQMASDVGGALVDAWNSATDAIDRWVNVARKAMGLAPLVTRAGEAMAVANQEKAAAAERFKIRQDTYNSMDAAGKREYALLKTNAEKNAALDEVLANRQSAAKQKSLAAMSGSASGFAQSPESKAAQDRQNAADRAVQSEINAAQAKVSAYQQSNAEQLKGLKYSEESVRLTERERAVRSELAQAESKHSSDLQSLLTKQIELKSIASGKDKEAAVIAQRELPAVEDAIKAVNAAYEAQVVAVTAAAGAAFDSAQKQIAAENLKLFSVSETTRATDDLKHLQDEMAMMTMPEILRKYREIENSARDAADTAIAGENERRRVAGLGALSEAERSQYIAAAAVKMEELKQQTKANYDASRSWNTGWKKAFNDYKENATNAAKQAEAVFSKATSGMEDMIVNFAKTGKFEWKSFVADMLEQLLRSQIQQVFASMMGGMQTSMSGVTGGYGGGGNLLGGLLGSVGSLFGGGSNSGQTPPYVPAQSNSGGGFGDILGSIGGGISSAISGISDFFGGFFANGGNLGAGKWGIAGENGPELISGPATVTPMGGGTNVTYNINAVDAMSFKQLVAQDPGFIHAVVMQGAKSTPGTWR